MSASAIVSVPIRVILSQPWSDKHEVGDVIKQARQEAKQTVTRLLKDATNVEQHGEIKVKIIYEEGR
jgi:hypothetical protein